MFSNSLIFYVLPSPSDRQVMFGWPQISSPVAICDGKNIETDKQTNIATPATKKVPRGLLTSKYVTKYDEKIRIRCLNEVCLITQVSAVRACDRRTKRRQMVAGRVVHKGTVHLAGRRLFLSTRRTRLVDRVVCTMVFVEVEDSATRRRSTQFYQRLPGQVTTTQDDHTKYV